MSSNSSGGRADTDSSGNVDGQQRRSFSSGNTETGGSADGDKSISGATASGGSAEIGSNDDGDGQQRQWGYRGSCGDSARAQ